MDDEDARYVKLESLIDVDTSENKIVLNNTPLVICSENGVPSEYMPCLENGQIVLRKIENSRLDPPPPSEVTDDDDGLKVETEHISVESEVVIQESVILNSIASVPRKKLSYETTFTPSVPVLKSVNRGIIRYGSKHLIIDQHIRIPPREFKRQLNNSDDLITNLELAPCSKSQMHRMLSGFTRMFAHPAHRMPNAKLLQLYASHCISHKQENVIDNEEMDELSGNCGVPFDFANMRRLSRKRKCNVSENENSAVVKVDSVRNSASFDHKYSKQIDSSAATSQEDHTSDSLSENGETFMIIDDSGANLTQNNLEILLAAASETSELNQIVTICEDNDRRYSKRIIIVANDKIEQILGAEY